ncbi:MAG TPA: ABC transporter ATP-binding protein [Acidimicrobiia bacterium]|jgi:ABC-2 type transport system ATP-binding protein|nr:ABC transporter ATP-binding protein [Acidimicrobiia bacterium]
MPVIEVENLVKTYDGVNVVDGISFTVDEGEIFGIVGPNGAGKTTTVESVEGLRVPDGGSIRVLGLHPIEDRYEITERLGAQLQESRLQDRIKVSEALELYASFYRNPADWPQLIERLGLAGKADTRYSDLSGGQKQRLSVALALVGSPEVAVLDELTTGLDPAARRSTWETIEEIRAGGVTVVLVTHFMEEAERLCDRIMVVDGGRVVAIDTPAGLVDRIGSRQVLRFRPSVAIDDGLLTALPEVASVAHHGQQLEVAGTGNVVHAVTALLAQRRVIAEDLRIEQHTLEDAYLALTGSGSGFSTSGREDR